MTPGALRAAMAIRGVSLRNGEFCREVAAEVTLPPRANYEAFVARAAEIVDLAERPVPVAQLVTDGALVSEAIPGDTIEHHMRVAGIYLIPGLGYWKHPQFITSRGEIFTAPIRDTKSEEMLRAFTLSGWPLSGEDVERVTNGVVTSRYVTHHAHRRRHRFIKSIAHGLFVPEGAFPSRDMPIPMTRPVAAMLLENKASEAIFASENARLYKLANLLKKHGMATTREAWPTHNGRRQRALFMELTPDGYQKLKGIGATIRDVI